MLSLYITPKHTYAFAMCVFRALLALCALLLICLLVSLPLWAQNWAQNNSLPADESTPLTITLVQPLQFPRIVVSDASHNGATCVANGIQNPKADSLCPGKIGTPMQLHIQGAANALISLQHTSESQKVNGLQFNLLNTPLNTILKSNGKRILNVAAFVQLIDKHAVRETRLPLHYDVSVVYQ